MKNLLAVLCLVPALAFGAEKGAKPAPNLPGVDWNVRTIKATGRGAPNLGAASPAAARIGAEKAAEVDALRNILGVLKGVQISSGKTVNDAMAASDETRARLEGEAKGFKRVATRYFSDGGVEIDVEMSIVDLLTELAPVDPKTQQAQLPAAGANSPFLNSGA